MIHLFSLLGCSTSSLRPLQLVTAGYPFATEQWKRPCLCYCLAYLLSCHPSKSRASPLKATSRLHTFPGCSFCSSLKKPAPSQAATYLSSYASASKCWRSTFADLMSCQATAAYLALVRVIYLHLSRMSYRRLNHLPWMATILPSTFCQESNLRLGRAAESSITSA